MHRIFRAAIAAAILAAPIAAQKSESTDDNFQWSGKMPSGAWIRVYNLNGEISVERATGDVAEVSGEKRWRRGDPKEVRFVVVKDGENMTICALWGDESTCDARGMNNHRRHHDDDYDNHNDVNVKFVIKLPKGVKVSANTVNGSLTSDFPLLITGRVDPKHIRAKIGTGNRRVELSTVNGSIELRKGS